MVLRPFSASWVDIYTDGAIHVINEQGLGGLTVRALADWMGVTPASVSQRTSRDQLVADVVDQFCHRWLQWIDDREFEHGVISLLPTNDEELPGVRVWLALLELGRADERTGRRVAAARAEERTLLLRLAGGELSADEVDRLVAVVDGLRLAVCAPVEPMPVTRAMELLEGHTSVRPKRAQRKQA
jgi:AcrR family transcriptional regulator